MMCDYLWACICHSSESSLRFQFSASTLWDGSIFIHFSRQDFWPLSFLGVFWLQLPSYSSCSGITDTCYSLALCGLLGSELGFVMFMWQAHSPLRHLPNPHPISRNLNSEWRGCIQDNAEHRMAREKETSTGFLCVLNSTLPFWYNSCSSFYTLLSYHHTSQDLLGSYSLTYHLSPLRTMSR